VKEKQIRIYCSTKSFSRGSSECTEDTRRFQTTEAGGFCPPNDCCKEKKICRKERWTFSEIEGSRNPKEILFVNQGALEGLYSSTENQNGVSIDTLGGGLEVLPKLLYQHQDRYPETCYGPISQRGKYEDWSKGKTFLPWWPVQWVINVIRWLRNQDNVFLGFEIMVSCGLEIKRIRITHNQAA
jgi:hypothetical protein